MGQMKVWIEVLQLASRLNLKYLRRFIFFCYFYHIFVSPGNAPEAITLNVVWMEREFDAYKLSRCMCPSNYNRFWDRARYLWKKSSCYHTPLHSTPPLGGFPSEYRHPVWCGKTRMMGLLDSEKNEDMCNRLGTIPACDGQTDGHLATAYTRYAYASRTKNAPTLVLSSFELHWLILTIFGNIIRIIAKTIRIFNFNVSFTFNNFICC